jgi:hypothetical protein
LTTAGEKVRREKALDFSARNSRHRSPACARCLLGGTSDEVPTVFVDLAFRQYRFEPINDAFGRLLRNGPRDLNDFQFIRSLNDSATQFGWKTRFVASQYPIQRMRQNCRLIVEVLNPLKNPDDGWIWQ